MRKTFTHYYELVKKIASSRFSAILLLSGTFGGLLQAQTTIFIYTGAVQNYTVPPGTGIIQIELWGAQGGSAGSSTGGLGGYVKGTMTVTPGEVLAVYVGGQNSFNGGGTSGSGGGYISATGGGASDIRRNGTALTDRVAVAGGGGGAGRSTCNTQQGGAGGYPGGGGGRGDNVFGGAGTFTSGGSVAQGGGCSQCCSSSRGGGGGGQVGGGAQGGYSVAIGGTNGACGGQNIDYSGGCGTPLGGGGCFGTGGNGQPGGCNGGGGGGGGGWYGGGCGGGNYGSGGGGGSSYIGTLSNTVATNGTRSGDGQVIITVLFAAPVIQINPLCNGDATGSATITTPTGYPGPYTYSWLPSGSTSTLLTGLTAGTYTYMVAAPGGTMYLPLTITQPSAVSASISQTNINCFSASTGVISPTLTGGTAPYSYTWSPSASSLQLTGLPAGIYTLSIKDVNNCSGAKTITLTQPTGPFQITGSATNPVICNGNTTTLNGSGANTYTWTGGVINGSAFSPTVTTTYTVSGQNALGCPGLADVVTVTVNPIPVVSISGTSTLCAGSSVTLSVSGASTYTWSNSLTTATISVSPSSGTSYSVKATSALGCTNTALQAVTVYSLPVISVSSGSICAGAVFTMVPSGASTYTFSNGSNTVSPLTTTSYSVSGTSSAGCVNAGFAISSVTVGTLPVISVNSGSICNGSTFTIVPSGASTYTISGGSDQVSPSTPTSYSVSGTSSVGCVSAAQAISSVSVYAIPLITVNSGSICAGNIFTIVPGGASTYTYSNGSNTVSPSANQNYSVSGTSTAGCVSNNMAVSSVSVIALPVITVNSGSICAGTVFTMVPSGASTYTFSNGSNTVSPLTTTSYSVSGTSSAGCVNAGFAISSVAVGTLPVISVNSGSICNGSTFTIVPSGASTYTISGGSYQVSPSTTTSYSVSGTSSVGCVSAAQAISSVSVYAIPLITVNSGSICAGNIFTIVPGGASTYTYSNGSNTVSPSANQNYSVSGTSTAGCVSNNMAVSSVSVIALPVITVNSSTLCAGTVFTMVPSGASTYTFSNGSNTVSPLTTTSYSVSGTNSAGCISSISAVSEVTVYASPVLTITAPVAICVGATATLAVSGASTYVWNTTATTATISDSPVTTTSYTVTGTDLNSCVNSATASVAVNALPVVAINGPFSICPGLVAVLAASGGSSYLWSNAAVTTTISVSPIVTTTYSVTGTDANGCQADAIYTLTINALPNIGISTSNSVICKGESVSLTATGGISYVWYDSSTASQIVVLPSTTTLYTVTGTDANGCENTAAITQSVSECTGISSIIPKNSDGISIFPNPNNGTFIISAKSGLSLSILNELGEVVKAVNLSAENNHSVSIDNLSNGIYFVIGHINSTLIKYKLIVTK